MELEKNTVISYRRNWISFVVRRSQFVPSLLTMISFNYA